MTTGKFRVSLSIQHTWKNHSFCKMSPLLPRKKALIRFLLLPAVLPWQIIHAPLHGVSVVHPLVWLLQDPTIGKGSRKSMGFETSVTQNPTLPLLSKASSEGKENLGPLSEICPECIALLCCCGSQ